MQAIHEKAAKQMLRTLQNAQRGAVSSDQISEERREEQRAGATVRETGKMAGVAASRAARGVVSGVRQAIRVKETRQGIESTGRPAQPFAAEPPAHTPEQRGRKLAQVRAKQRFARDRKSVV